MASQINEYEDPVDESPAGSAWEDELFGQFASVDGENDTADEYSASISTDTLRALQQLAEPPDALQQPSEDRFGEKPDFEQNTVPHNVIAEHGQLTDSAGTAFEVPIVAPARLGEIESPELAEAFLQDASRGIAALEQAVILYQSQNDQEEALSQIARELHTLKGASATVALTDVARYIHDIETFIQSPDVAETQLTDTMFECVDTLRRQASQLAGHPDTSPGQPTMATSSESTSEDSVCVRASQLDRLMDMLTALVMLRNQRESRVAQLREVNSELARCGTRLRAVERQLLSGDATSPSTLLDRSNPLAEVANDLSEVGRRLGESYGPVSEENVAVSNFIRQFRKALLELLRTPMSGLFLRLQRAAIDAARIEGKQVRLMVVGSDVGLERSVQERLFDPLLHIVRNAVGHGIETADEREAAGKEPVGTITLEASGTPNLLILTIRDDGRGLDYDALRRRGIELGILTGDRRATPQELAQLIFRPGFSTRSVVNNVAGRGIGMDVVADTLDRMHSWIEVDSTPGKGTTVRLTVPLRSIIDHVMVVRAAGQLFAIPMHYIRQVEETHQGCEEAVVRLASLLGLPQNESPDNSATTKPARFIVEAQPTLSQSTQGPVDSTGVVITQRDMRIELEVDDILGPEEVVVRPLPPLFRHQSLFGGVTLSANGEIVLVLTPRYLLESARGCNTTRSTSNEEVIASQEACRVLVVDDSLSARRHAGQTLSKQGWNVVEVSNAATALDRLNNEEFVAVVTDFDMPAMDGLQLVQAIRENPSRQDVPIFMLSSRTTEEMEAPAVEAGVSLYFRKPLSDAHVQEIAQLLRTT